MLIGWRPEASIIRGKMSNSSPNSARPWFMSKSDTACKTPWSSPTKASAMPVSSRTSASEAGVHSPLASRWLSVRPVLKPTAPASSASRVSWRIRAISSSEAGSSAMARSRITYTRSASCGTWAAKSIVWGIASSESMYSGNVSQSQVIPSESAEPGMSSTPSMSSTSR